MKWFKHYTNAHKGNVLQSLYLEFGLNEGYALYFRLLEYLADKWDGEGDPKFKILTSELRRYLAITTPKLRRLAAAVESSANSLFKVSEDFCEIELPKLLEIRHRDSIPSSQRQAKIQPESAQEKNKRKKNIKEWQQKAFDLLVARFKNFFPDSEKGKNAFPRFCEHAKTESEAAAIVQSVSHYATHLKSLTWERHPKTSVATYLGPIKEPFWSEYREPKPGASVNAAGSMRGA